MMTRYITVNKQLPRLPQTETVLKLIQDWNCFDCELVYVFSLKNQN